LLLDDQGIRDLVEKMDNEVKALKEEIFRTCWFMRGGVTLEEAWNLDNADRQLINELIQSNLETTKETGMAFF
jgi:hypothetical protein